MELDFSPVAEDVSLSSDFKELLKSVCTCVSGKRDIPMEEKAIHGIHLPFVWFLDPFNLP